jgi:hypothetical protein
MEGAECGIQLQKKQLLNLKPRPKRHFKAFQLHNCTAARQAIRVDWSNVFAGPLLDLLQTSAELTSFAKKSTKFRHRHLSEVPAHWIISPKL